MIIPEKKQYVIDTCILLSYFQNIFKISSYNITSNVSQIFDDVFSATNNQKTIYHLIISCISFVEIHEKWCTTEEQTKKIYCEVFKPICECENIHICPIDNEIFMNTLRIQGFDFENHDKFIVGTAVTYKCPLISTDSNIQNFAKTHNELTLYREYNSVFP